MNECECACGGGGGACVCEVNDKASYYKIINNLIVG